MDKMNVPPDNHFGQRTQWPVLEEERSYSCWSQVGISVGNGCRFGKVYNIYKCAPPCYPSYMINKNKKNKTKKQTTVTVVNLFHIRLIHHMI